MDCTVNGRCDVHPSAGNLGTRFLVLGKALSNREKWVGDVCQESYKTERLIRNIPEGILSERRSHTLQKKIRPNAQ